MSRSSIAACRRLGAVSFSCAALALSLSGCEGPRFHGTQLDAAAEAPEIEAADMNGRAFRLSEHRGSVVLVTFGYTSCPDVCPMTLARLKGLRERLGREAERLSIVFVSVDPERDTAERLQSYLSAFDPSFKGLRVERRALSRLLASYRASATIRPEERARRDTSGGLQYNIDHTSGYFVIDKAGVLRLRIGPDASLEDIQSDVGRLLREEA